MKHQVEGRKFDRETSHRMSMFRNLVTDLLDHEKIVTTEPKAKEVQSMAEKMITLGKRGNLHARRQAIAFLTEERIADKVFEELAKRYAERKGGYTRIVKLGRRQGDGAEMVQFELVK
jgi:large subunit ribosomal protein L17